MNYSKKLTWMMLLGLFVGMTGSLTVTANDNELKDIQDISKQIETEKKRNVIVRFVALFGSTFKGGARLTKNVFGGIFSRLFSVVRWGLNKIPFVNLKEVVVAQNTPTIEVENMKELLEEKKEEAPESLLEITS